MISDMIVNLYGGGGREKKPLIRDAYIRRDVHLSSLVWSVMSSLANDETKDSLPCPKTSQKKLVPINY